MAVKTINVQQYSYGFLLELPSGLVLNGTIFELELRPPSGVKIIKNNSSITVVTGTNNFRVFIDDGDLAESGIYDYQIKDISSGKVIYGEVKQFSVSANLSYTDPV